jgi:hypothetical protein
MYVCMYASIYARTVIKPEAIHATLIVGQYLQVASVPDLKSQARSCSHKFLPS